MQKLINVIKVISSPHNANIRTMASKVPKLKISSLKYGQFGEPAEVIEMCEEEIDCINDNAVLVKILAAPINPADINTIQGKYPVKPAFPAIGGNEFVGEVMEVGTNVKTIKPGDRVIPGATGLGSWSSHGIYEEKNLIKISSKLSIAHAATLTVNPCTAYRMLKDFVCLQPDDVIIQNGANSAVGQSVHQLCKIWNIKSVGIVRDRPEIDALRKQLKDLGATEILTEEEIRKSDIFKKTLKKPKLALNCVGGPSATEIARHLENKGTLVTYGGMSMKPVTVSTAALIFKDIRFLGFWMTRWTKENHDNPERSKMFEELCQVMENGSFKAPKHEMVPIMEYKKAMEAAANFGGANKKIILDFSSLSK